MPLYNRSMFRQLIAILFIGCWQSHLGAHSLDIKDQPWTDCMQAYSEPKEDSCLAQPCLVYWPDSLCQPEVLRRLMGDLPIEVGNVQRPEIYWMLQKWALYPYRYAGYNAKGIDCSGLICEIQQTVYGRPYRGSSSDIYSKLQRIPRQSLQEGDMVFFKIRRKRISHVGLYLGSNKFLHITTKAGVIISDLDEPYYRKRYFGAGRDPEPPRFSPLYVPQPGLNTSHPAP